jgi:ribosome-associated protein
MATRKASSPKTAAPKVSKEPKASKKVVPIDPEEALARLCAEGALDKKAEDVVILDMRGISSFTDFFVIVSGTSEPQLKAIAGSIRERVREATGQRPTAEDGFPVSQWVIVDYGSVIVHIFHRERRPVYGLEDLWNDAKRIEIAS